MRTKTPLVALSSVLAAADIAACGSGNNQYTPSTLAQGSENGACYPNATCNAGLLCLANVCVNPRTGAGGSGDAGVGGAGGGNAGSSGTAGAGGVSGWGGGGATTTVTVGPTGATVELGQLSVTIPAGALPTSTAITVTQTTDPQPAGYMTYSPVYKFEPEGTTFQKPVTVKLPFNGSSQLASTFWSLPGPTGTTGYQWIGGTVSGATISAQVDHFSKGFVANGVQYSDPPDQSCVVTRLLQGRKVEPSGIAMFFAVDDCWGRPITSLGSNDFEVAEDGAALSQAESSAAVYPKQGVALFALLLLDVSDSMNGFRQQMIDGAKSYLAGLTGANLRVHVGIELFDRSANLTQWQAPTLDYAAIGSQLDKLSGFASSNGAGTNLNGAIVQGLQQLSSVEESFRSRNYGGALTSGYLMVFTDGSDTAGIVSQTAAESAVNTSSDGVIAVGIQGKDWNAQAQASLSKLAPNGLVVADVPGNLDKVFGNLAYRMGGEANRLYLLGYCSPKAAGDHTVTVTKTGSMNESQASYKFNASGFGPGCSQNQFDPSKVCVGKQCGGLGCGACDDHTDGCDETTNQCVSYCVKEDWCGGDVRANPQGYAQTCPNTATSTKCGSNCVDTTSDMKNCGGCANACPLEATSCSGTPAQCACPGGPCQVLAPAQYPTTIAVDATNAYWITLGTPAAVMKVSSGGGTPVTLASGGTPKGIAVDSTSVYWTDYDAGTVMKVAIGGGNPVTVASEQAHPFGIAVDGTNVYWTNVGIGTYGTHTPGTVMKVPVSGGSPVTLASCSNWCDETIVVDATSVYWSLTDINQGGGAAYGRIRKVPIGGGSAVDLGQWSWYGDMGGHTNIALDATSVYWANWSLQAVSGAVNLYATVMKAPIGGGDTITLASGPWMSLTGLAVDASSVYWTGHSETPSQNTLMKAPIGGGSPVILASSAKYDSYQGIALDPPSSMPRSLYWTATATTGAVLKLTPN